MCFLLSSNLPTQLHPFSLFFHAANFQCFYLVSTSPVNKGVCSPSTIGALAKPFIGSLNAQLAKKFSAAVPQTGRQHKSSHLGCQQICAHTLLAEVSSEAVTL